MWKYERNTTEDLTLTAANRPIRMWGVTGQLTITAYSVTMSDNTLTAVSFKFHADPERKNSLNFNNHTGGVFRTVEQKIVLPSLNGTILELSDLSIQEDVFAARTLCDALLRKTASIIESARLSVRNNLGRDMRDYAISRLAEYFEKEMITVVNSMLGEINWPLMLSHSGCTEQILTVINTTLTRHNINRFGINYDGETGIAPIRNERFQVDTRGLADLKAAALLKHVCGEELYNEFKETGKITVWANGFKFEIAPGKFVDVTDPNGGQAQFCIHTARLSCNPIDEVVLAQQHIKHQFNWYMKTAIVHNARGGFKKEYFVA